MFIVELALLAFLICFALVGFKRGFFKSIGRLIGVIVGFLVARAWAPAAVRVIVGFFPGRIGLLEIVVFTSFFLFVERVVGWILRLVGGVFRCIPRYAFFNKAGSFLGGALGAVEGSLLAGGILYWIRIQRLDPTLMGWLSRSQVAGFLDSVFRSVLGFII